MSLLLFFGEAVVPPLDVDRLYFSNITKVKTFDSRTAKELTFFSNITKAKTFDSKIEN
jgi:hypothetical protein